MIARPPCPTAAPAPPRQPEPAPDLAHPHPPLSAQEARAEAARCLAQSPCQGCQVCELICPDQAITRDPISGLPVIDLDFCKGCGLCAHFCPRGALAMEPEE
ncbi:MAG: 4Fe-4S binding protein [Desulfarculus sp.]|nr:4Fe-4S binding protein [Desulfarculus sp.]